MTSSDLNSVNDAIKELKLKYKTSSSALALIESNHSISLELKNTYAKGEAVEGMFEGRKTEGKGSDTIGS